MAFRISFFNTPKHRVFNYRPLYYDPEKDEREQRRALLRTKMEEEKRKKGIIPNETDAPEDLRTREDRLYYPGRSIRGSFQKALYENRRQAGDNKWTRAVVILSIIVLLVALLYFADGLGFLLSALSRQQPVTP